MSGPLVSVIIPAYNGQRFLQACIDSALAQTYRPMEIIAVNDGSTDGTAALLSGYGDRIRVFHQDNAGQAAARNLGILKSTGEWIAFLDQDDLWDEEKTEVQMSHASEHDTVIYTNARIIDEAGRVTRQPMLSADQIATRLLDLIVSHYISPLITIVRRRAVNDVGGFDPANRFGSEDYQLWLRLAAKGYSFRFVDKVLASCRIHGTNMSLNRSNWALGDMHALVQTRREYPQAFGRPEIQAFHRKISEIYYNVGWHQYNRGDYQAAARNFWRAVFHNPRGVSSWAHAVATILPFRGWVLPRLRALIVGKSVDQAQQGAE